MTVRLKPRDRALADLVSSAREIRAVHDAQVAYTRMCQAAAAEARRTGISRRPPDPKAFDYGGAVASLLDALDRFEKAQDGTLPPKKG